MICGPYEYGAPMQAAHMALKSCQAISQELEKQGFRLSLRFSPKAEKGKITLKPLMLMQETGETDA